MTNTRIGVKFIHPQPEPDGSRVLTVYAFGSGEVDVVFSEDEAVQLVRMFQQGFVERQGKRTVHPHYPVLSVLGADLAHGQTDTGLLIETAENGSMVLTFSDSVASRLKAEIDRVVSTRAARMLERS